MSKVKKPRRATRSELVVSLDWCAKRLAWLKRNFPETAGSGAALRQARKVLKAEGPYQNYLPKNAS